MINVHVAISTYELECLLSAAIHSMTSYITDKGRSPHQAVCGKAFRLPGGMKAEHARALSHLASINVDKGLRVLFSGRLKIPRSSPEAGLQCAFWRWRKQAQEALDSIRERSHPRAYRKPGLLPSGSNNGAQMNRTSRPSTTPDASIDLQENIWKDKRGEGPPADPLLQETER